MAAYKMAAVKVTPPNDFHLGLIRSHMVVIHLFLMLCDLQRVGKGLTPHPVYLTNEVASHTIQHASCGLEHTLWHNCNIAKLCRRLIHRHTAMVILTCLYSEIKRVLSKIFSGVK
jgi:hypothetical protein